MKKYFKYLISTFILTSFIIGQVTESMVEFRMGKHNALRLILIDVDKKLVEGEWKLYTKSFDKPNKKKGEFITIGVNLNGLSNPVDWYMKLDKKKKNVLLQLCVISNEEFLSSSNQSDNYGIIENYLEKFVFVVEKVKVKEKFETEGKTLTKLQKKLKNLNKNYDSNLKSIEKHTKKIENAEKDNKSNLKKQAKTKDEISTQGLIVEEILSNPSGSINEGEVSPEYEEANKKLLKLQKKIEKLASDYESNLKSINKSLKKIEQAKKDNRSIIKSQKKIKEKISDQGEIVEQLREQLETMK
jgi:DNA-binding ferritin-like protein (Dps family)